MSARSWFERQEQRVKDINEGLKSLDNASLGELARCAESDQLPGPSNANGSNRSSVGSHSDPTGDAATAAMDQICAAKGCTLLAGDHDQADHPFESWVQRVDQWVQGFESNLAMAARHMERADRFRALICNRARELDRTFPKPGAGDCQACERWVPGTASDRIKSGYCPACWMAWQRAGHPDRTRFAYERKQRADTEQRKAS